MVGKATFMGASFLRWEPILPPLAAFAPNRILNYEHMLTI